MKRQSSIMLGEINTNRESDRWRSNYEYNSKSCGVKNKKNISSNSNRMCSFITTCTPTPQKQTYSSSVFNKNTRNNEILPPKAHRRSIFPQYNTSQQIEQERQQRDDDDNSNDLFHEELCIPMITDNGYLNHFDNEEDKENKSFCNERKRNLKPLAPLLPPHMVATKTPKNNPYSTANMVDYRIITKSIKQEQQQQLYPRIYGTKTPLPYYRQQHQDQYDNPPMIFRNTNNSNMANFNQPSDEIKTMKSPIIPRKLFMMEDDDLVPFSSARSSSRYLFQGRC